MVARSAAPLVELPSETVTVEPLGGDVLVCGFDMPQLLRFMAAKRRLSEKLDGENQDQAEERAVAEVVPFALHLLVLADDGLPLYTEAQWRIWGARNGAAALELFAVAMRLSGNDKDTEKKT
jgi:hypothetical protein